jgi:tetratricopeptide (TPR) repeat protein
MSDSGTQDLAVLAADAQTVVRAAEEAVQTGEPARLIAALQECDRILKALPEELLNAETKAPDPADALAFERALLWFWRGRLLVMADKPEPVVQGLHSLDQAIARLRLAGLRDGAQNALTQALMNRGSGLFRLGSRDALAEAVRSYDLAIESMAMRTGVDANTLGAAWMNRGVGLMHLEQPNETKESVASRLVDATKSFERAVAVLEPLANVQPGAQRNLAAAWANIGMLRTRLEDTKGACEAHRLAVELFRPLVATGGAAETFELAARLFNLGQACGALGETEAALTAGREAMTLADKVKSDDPQVAELGLRARHAVCVALGGQIAAGRAEANDPQRSARLAEAGDLVEDGLTALRTLGALPPPVSAASVRLYEFGAWLYRTQQPHFLGEFLLEHLGEDPARAQIAAESVRVARQALVQRGFNETIHGDMDRVLDVLQDLGLVEKRLKERGVTV